MILDIQRGIAVDVSKRNKRIVSLRVGEAQVQMHAKGQ